ncbi:hypothetical protein GF351_00700 [Candidatus Woesearchaeota archaeon]|nr:hypothetical protein [Candidatus Woesearchaeota archaeon]
MRIEKDKGLGHLVAHAQERDVGISDDHRRVLDYFIGNGHTRQVFREKNVHGLWMPLESVYLKLAEETGLSRTKATLAYRDLQRAGLVGIAVEDSFGREYSLTEEAYQIALGVYDAVLHTVGKPVVLTKDQRRLMTFFAEKEGSRMVEARSEDGIFSFLKSMTIISSEAGVRDAWQRLQELGITHVQDLDDARLYALTEKASYAAAKYIS